MESIEQKKLIPDNENILNGFCRFSDFGGRLPQGF